MSESRYYALPDQQPKRYFQGMRDLFLLHDRQVLLILTVTYAAQGLQALGNVSTLLYFKDELHIADEAQAQMLISSTLLPWCMKPVYGLVSDSFPICGSHRKAYLLIASVIAAVSYMSFLFELGLTASVLALIGGQLGQVVADIMADALMVVESRKDTANGSSFLQAYSWTVLSIVSLGGGFVGYWLSSLEVEASKILGLLSVAPIMLIAVVIGYKEPSRDAAPNLQLSLSRLYQALCVPSTYRCLLFVYLITAFTPSLGQVRKYFLLNELKFTKEFLYFIRGLSGICFIVGSFLFSNWLKAWRFRSLLFCGNALMILCSTFDLGLIFRVFEVLHMPGTLFYMVGAYVGSSISIGFIMMPILVMTAQVCPLHLEATMYAFVISIKNLGSLTSELYGSGITRLVMDTPGDYSDYYQLILIQITAMILGFTLILLLPDQAKPTDAPKST